tara:strand:+ start:65 stop:520 length:456 start_codon:yes stop_codon:yes gene_type:complete
MSIDDNLFIQGALNGEDLSKPPWKLDEEILPLLKYLWERGIETNSSCASHLEPLVFKDNTGPSGYSCIHPYVEVSIDTNLSELKKKTESLSYRIIQENSGHHSVKWKGLMFINIKVGNAFIARDLYFISDPDATMTLKELIKENHEFLGNW